MWPWPKYIGRHRAVYFLSETTVLKIPVLADMWGCGEPGTNAIAANLREIDKCRYDMRRPLRTH